MYQLFEIFITTLPAFIILLFLTDVMNALIMKEYVSFQNTIMNLNVENVSYSLKDIKNIYCDTLKLNVNSDELSEFHIKKIHRLLSNVDANLLKDKATYYYALETNKIFIMLVSFFFKKKSLQCYHNDKSKKTILKTIIQNILNELDEEKKFFGLHTREKYLFSKLMNNENINNENKEHIFELKNIVLSRYQELVKKEDTSEKLSKRSLKVGYIGLFLGLISCWDIFIRIIK